HQLDQSQLLATEQVRNDSGAVGVDGHRTEVLDQLSLGAVSVEADQMRSRPPRGFAGDRQNGEAVILDPLVPRIRLGNGNVDGPGIDRGTGQGHGGEGDTLLHSSIPLGLGRIWPGASDVHTSNRLCSSGMEDILLWPMAQAQRPVVPLTAVLGAEWETGLRDQGTEGLRD